MRRYLRPYLALVPRDVNADGIRLVQAIVDSSPVPNLAARLATLTPVGMLAAFVATSHLPDSAEVSSTILRSMVAHTGAGPTPADSAFARRQLARNLLSRGHLRAGYRVMGRTLELFLTEATLLGAVPAESIAPALGERLAGDFDVSLNAAFPWWARQRDTASLRKAAGRAKAAANTPSQGNPRVAGYLAQSAAHIWLSPGATAVRHSRASSPFRQPIVPPATTTG